MQAPIFAWHVHHEKLLEALTEPIGNRIEYIKSNKPQREVATRLRLLKVIGNQSIINNSKARDAYSKAWDAYSKAWDAYNKAWDAYSKAWDAYGKAGDACDKAWDAYSKAGDAYSKAWDACDKAWDAYIKAGDTLQTDPEILALHALECKDCPWNGKTIFP